MATTSRSARRRRSLTADTDAGDDLHEAAVRLLARREHTGAELAAKLERRGHERAAVRDEIERLAAAGLQSDARFAERFVEERVERGDGPLKLRAALDQRGVAATAIDAALAAFEGDWEARARAAAQRRFGATPPGDWNERARRARFLQQRGFPADVVRRVTAFDDTAAED